MAISKKNKALESLYNLVHKEFIVFEPQDRIPIEVRSGEKGYTVGSVLYSSDYGRLCVQYFDAEGYLVVPNHTVHFVEDLPEARLKELEAKVVDYVERASYRAAHIKAISDALEQLPGKSYDFAGAHQPTLLVESFHDGHSLDLDTFWSIYKADGVDEILLSGVKRDASGNGEQYNYPLNYLTDNGVATVYSAISPVLRKEVSETISDGKAVRRTNVRTL